MSIVVPPCFLFRKTGGEPVTITNNYKESLESCQVFKIITLMFVACNKIALP